MSQKLYLLIFLLFSLNINANAKKVIFVIDNSGSCWSKSNINKQEASIAMLKNAKGIFSSGDTASILVGNKDKCAEGEIATSFVDNLKDFKASIASIKENTVNDSIVSGFKAAQKKMIDNDYEGHIYLVGDCDGLSFCGGIEKYTKKLLKENKLTPFTYLFTEGCTDTEINNWNSLVISLNMIKPRIAATFNYKKIVAKARKKREDELKKQYFTKPKFLNKDASSNDGMNMRTALWRCVESDDLKWLVIDKKEQELDFFMQEPKTNAFYKKIKSNVLISNFIDRLNSENTCGRKDWRLPNLFELSRLTQLGSNRRIRLFPYIKIWPHISISGAVFTGYRKGIDLNNGKRYEYREDRPYAAMFVAGDIDATLFEPPIEFLSRYKITNRTIISPKPKVLIDDVIDDIKFDTLYNVEKDKLIESNIITITGINTTVPVKINHGELNVNNGAWGSSANVNSGDTIQVRHRSSPKENTEMVTDITLGLKMVTFMSKTKLQTLITPPKQTKEDDEPAAYPSILDEASGL